MTKTPNFPELNYKSDEDPLSYFSKVKNKAVYSAIICYLGPVLGFQFCGAPHLYQQLQDSKPIRSIMVICRGGDRNLTPRSESLKLYNQVHNYKLRERDGGNSEGLVDKC